METKKCPFCGEEIMTTAKKCRHCGEWLPMEQQIGKPFPNNNISTQTNVAESRKELPNAGMLQLACWITIVFEGISLMQSYTTEVFSFLTPIFEFFADNIPDWIVVIACAILWFILIMGLRTYCQIRNIGKMPFIALICLIVWGYLICLAGCFVEDEDLLLVIFLFLLPVLIAESILTLIIGIKLHKTVTTRRLGVWVMLGAIILWVSMIVEFGLWSGESQMIVTSSIGYIVTIAQCIELTNVFSK